MDRRRMTALCIIAIALACAGILATRPIAGTWVCSDRLTESAMLTDEVTTITIRPDRSVYFRSYGDYIGRYRILNGMGSWEQVSLQGYSITITQGIVVSCQLAGNCTYSELIPFSFSVDHDLISDTIAYDPQAAPEFSSIRPFVRSIVRDCSEGCEG